MKKILLPLLSIAIIFTMVACSDTSSQQLPQDQNGAENSTVENDKTDNENQIERETEPVNEPVENEFENISVTITEKVNIPENIDQHRFSDRVEFTFLIDNASDKTIKGIQGVLEIYDLFGEGILSINADLTGNSVLPNESISISNIGMDINEFLDEHTKLYNENYSDLSFEYVITNVVFSDNDVEQNTTNSNTSSATVTVTNKYNLDENWDAGRFSPRIQLDFELSNLSDKEIKGIQGVITIKDMFGEEIKSFNCDFTGNTIPANGKIAVTDLGVDVNEFIDEDVKLYNEVYEDLIFEYTITKIVYSDGTIEE